MLGYFQRMPATALVLATFPKLASHYVKEQPPVYHIIEKAIVRHYRHLVAGCRFES
jgi:hypothetical protein